ncbi:MAG: YlbL family protein [Marmoricola sp.]
MTSNARRRNLAALLSVAFIAGLAIWATQLHVGYTLYSPGPTVNILGASKGKPIVEVSGRKSYHDGGQLRLVTVYESGVDQRVSLPEALLGWLDPKVNVYPHDAVYPRQETTKSVQQQSSLEMASSQDNAIAAALHVLGIHFSQAVRVHSVEKGAPARGHLKAGDLVLSVDGHPARQTGAMANRIKRLRPGTRVHLAVSRDGQRRTVTVTTGRLGSSGKERRRSHLGVAIEPSYHFPFRVRLRLADNIGGPSAGMMFAIAVYDQLTPGSLTDGRTIAGTGEIDARGVVGEIGGIQQKIVGAQRDGAELFLVPSGNCAEALGADYDPQKMRLVRVHRLRSAISDVRRWAHDSRAPLPSCRPGGGRHG